MRRCDRGGTTEEIRVAHRHRHVAEQDDGVGALRLAGRNVCREARDFYQCEDAIAEELLKKLELLIVIDTLPSKTTELAHYVLPGATFAEKRGTFINAKMRSRRNY